MSPSNALAFLALVSVGLYTLMRSGSAVALAHPVEFGDPLRGFDVSLSGSPILVYFEPEEFGEWWPLMSRELLEKLDSFRSLWGAPVVISPAAGAIGRHGGESVTSQHNVDRYGEVRAVDVFPMLPNGAYISTASDRARAVDVAKRVGFTGIGVYVDTVPGNMVHLDVRAGALATWSRVGGEYKSLGAVA